LRIESRPLACVAVARPGRPPVRRSSSSRLPGGGCWQGTKSFEDELHARLESVVAGRALDQFGATLIRLRAANRSVTSSEEIAPAS
jgi:hypothetical protein